jgi:hypothetical protein
MAHSHIEPHTWFHPPSLKKPQHVPTDDPGETDDRFLDVTKRHSKDTEEMRNKMLKRSIPGGQPPQIPVRTTAMAPAQAHDVLWSYSEDEPRDGKGRWTVGGSPAVAKSPERVARERGIDIHSKKGRAVVAKLRQEHRQLHR